MENLNAKECSFTYEWHEGSLPPPFHYEWALSVHGLHGSLTFIPDYSGTDVPRWQRAVEITAHQQAHLIDLFRSRRVFRSKWSKPRRQRIGGETQYLTVQIGVETGSIPASRTDTDSRALQPLFEYIRSLVPQATWDELDVLREQYMQARQ